jgi:sugar phosphate isomerase/epimerase
METKLAGRRLSISNIAWPGEKDDEALDLISGLGFDGVELAPRKVFDCLETVSLDTVRTYRRRIEDRGLAISALQAILFGVKGAHLFESPASRLRMADYLRRVAEIAEVLGARACVFGSPTLRDPGELSHEAARMIAEEFLRSIAPDFAERSVDLCFEANPTLYQCRFITHTEEAFELVEHVNVPGIAMQLDTGTMFINGESPQQIRHMEHRIGHIHVSEPNLVPIGTANVNHADLANVLMSAAVSRWISIEMKAADDWRQGVRGAHSLVSSLYQPLCDTQ